MFTIWLIGIVVFGMYCAYRFGQAPTHLQEDAWGPMIIGVLFWPFALALAILLAPFAGMVYLGARAKKKKEN
jgi:hypothetical protein